MASTRRDLLEMAAESTRARDSAAHRVENRPIPALTLAWHPEIGRAGERVVLFELMAGREVEVSRLAPLFASLDSEPYPLADRFLSRRPLRLGPGSAGGARISTAGSGILLEVDGSAVAAGEELELDIDRLRRGVVLLLAGRIVLILHRVEELPPPAVPHFGLVGESCAVLRLRREIQRVAALDIPVLLRGATGTGKELAAAAIHRHGARRDGLFLTLNMAAIPPSLAAAELFGAERGAFTGAAQATPGHFRRAAGGTLFLDEIGEMPGEVQALLLRTLESGEIQPVGGGRPLASDARLVAATDADLEADVEAGRFRSPLLHRLAGYSIHLPALAERREDFGRLLLHFLRAELAAVGRESLLEERESSWLGAPLVARLARRPWPGNVRELRNAARRLAVGYSDRERVPAAALRGLGEAPAAPPAPPDGPGPTVASTYKPPSEIAEDELLDALRAHGFRTRPTARSLGISRTSLYSLIERSSKVRKAADLAVEEIHAALDGAGGDLEAAAARLEVSAVGLRRRLQEIRRGAS